MSPERLEVTVHPTLADFRVFGRERFLSSGAIQRLLLFTILALIAFLFATNRIAGAACLSLAVVMGFAYVSNVYAWFWSFPKRLWYAQEHLAPYCYVFSATGIAIAGQGHTSETVYAAFPAFVVLPSAVAIRMRGQGFHLIPRRELGDAFESLLALLRTKMPEAKTFESKAAGPA